MILPILLLIIAFFHSAALIHASTSNTAQNTISQTVFAHLEHSGVPDDYGLLEFYSNQPLLFGESFVLFPDGPTSSWFSPVALVNTFGTYLYPNIPSYAPKSIIPMYDEPFLVLSTQPCFAFDSTDRFTQTNPILAGFIADVSEYVYEGKREPKHALLFYATSQIPANWHTKCNGMFIDTAQPSQSSTLRIQNSSFGSRHGITYQIGGDDAILALPALPSEGSSGSFDQTTISFDYTPGEYDPELLQRVDALSISFHQMPPNRIFPFKLIFDVADRARLDRLTMLPQFVINNIYRFWSSPELSARFPPQCVVPSAADSTDASPNSPGSASASRPSPHTARLFIEGGDEGHLFLLTGSAIGKPAPTPQQRHQQQQQQQEQQPQQKQQPLDSIDDNLHQTHQTHQTLKESLLFSSLHSPSLQNAPQSPLAEFNPSQPHEEIIPTITCTIPIPLFLLQHYLASDKHLTQETSAMLKTVDIGRWQGRQIAVYAISGERYFRFRSTHPKATWDFAHPMMQLSSYTIIRHRFFNRTGGLGQRLGELRESINTSTVPTDLREAPLDVSSAGTGLNLGLSAAGHSADWAGTLYLTWNLILTGPYPDLQILKIHNIQPDTIMPRDLFDPTKNLATFEYILSPPDVRKRELHFPIKVDVDDPELAITTGIDRSKYNGYANVTISFKFEVQQLVPFNVELAVNGRPTMLSFLPSMVQSSLPVSINPDEITLGVRLTYKPYFQETMIVYGNDPNTPPLALSASFPLKGRKDDVPPPTPTDAPLTSRAVNPPLQPAEPTTTTQQSTSVINRRPHGLDDDDDDVKLGDGDDDGWMNWQLVADLSVTFSTSSEPEIRPPDGFAPLRCFTQYLDEDGTEFSPKRPNIVNLDNTNLYITTVGEPGDYTTVDWVQLQVKQSVDIRCTYSLTNALPFDLLEGISRSAILIPLTRFNAIPWDRASTRSHNPNTDSPNDKPNTNPGFPTDQAKSGVHAAFSVQTTHPIESQADFDAVLTTITTMSKQATYTEVNPDPSLTPNIGPSLFSKLTTDMWLMDMTLNSAYSNSRSFPSIDLKAPHVQDQDQDTTSIITFPASPHPLSLSQYPTGAILILNFDIADAVDPTIIDPANITTHHLVAHSTISQSGIFLIPGIVSLQPNFNTKARYWGPAWWKENFAPRATSPSNPSNSSSISSSSRSIPSDTLATNATNALSIPFDPVSDPNPASPVFPPLWGYPIGAGCYSGHCVAGQLRSSVIMFEALKVQVYGLYHRDNSGYFPRLLQPRQIYSLELLSPPPVPEPGLSLLSILLPVSIGATVLVLVLAAFLTFRYTRVCVRLKTRFCNHVGSSDDHDGNGESKYHATLFDRTGIGYNDESDEDEDEDIEQEPSPVPSFSTRPTGPVN